MIDLLNLSNNVNSVIIVTQQITYYWYTFNKKTSSITIKGILLEEALLALF